MRIITAAVLATLLLCAFFQSASAASDCILAVVNSEIITLSQVRARSAADEKRLRQTESEENLRAAIKVVRASILSRLIDRQVLSQEFTRLSVPVPANATDDLIDSVIRIRFHGDRQKWLNKLKPKAYIRLFGTLLEDIPRRPLGVATIPLAAGNRS